MGSQSRKKWFTFQAIAKLLAASLVVFIILLRFEIIGHPMLNMSFRQSDRRLQNQFEHEDIQPEIKYISSKSHTVRYIILENDKEYPYIVFIHGAPGSLSDYLGFFKDSLLNRQLNLISIDRPGYGYSDFGESEPSIAAQADAIQSVISSACKNDDILLVGHSYGGPIAIKMSMDNPGAYKAVVLLAPALDPRNEKVIRLAELPKIKIIRWLVPKALRVSADEKNSHIEELRNIEPGYNSISTPIYHIHGDADSLVPYENMAYSRSKIDEKYLQTVALHNADHFLPWSHHEMIVKKILEITSVTIHDE